MEQGFRFLYPIFFQGLSPSEISLVSNSFLFDLDTHLQYRVSSSFKGCKGQPCSKCKAKTMRDVRL